MGPEARDQKHRLANDRNGIGPVAAVVREGKHAGSAGGELDMATVPLVREVLERVRASAIAPHARAG